MNPNRLSAPRAGKTLVIAIVLLALLGGAGYAYYTYGGFASGPSQDQLLTTTVIRGPFDHIVLEQGEIESSSNIDVVCQVKSQSTGGSGGTPILWVIEEGTYVKAGDKLVELDSSALENQLKTQRIAVSSAQAMVISSEAAVRTAEIALQEYLEGTFMAERKAILSEIDVAQQALLNAELKLASAERLAAKGMYNKRQVQAEGFSVSNAKNTLESAQARLEILERLTKEKFRVQFESDIEAAKAKLESDTSVLAEEESKLREIEDQIAKCIILSPAEGVVVHNNEYSSRGGSEFVVEEGALVRERQTIIKLPDPTKMQVKASINEQNITLIAEGMAAKIKVNAVEGDMLARIKRVNKYPEPGSFFTSSVKKYSTYVEILEPSPTIRTGMTAEVRIFVKQLPDALQIPVHGIYEYKGHHFCLRKAGAGLETVQIDIGATNDNMVTIDSGLEEGDVVILNPRSHQDLMDLPEVDDVGDRSELAEIGAQAGEPVKPEELAAGGGGAPGAGPGGPGGPGAPGGGGRGPGGGGFNPQMMVDRIFQADANGDGKLSSDEMSGLDERLRGRAAEYDSNSDGELEKSEVLQGVQKAMAERAAAGGGS